MFGKVIFSAEILILINVGALNDAAAAIAVMMMLIGIITVHSIRELKGRRPVIYILLSILCLAVASVLNRSNLFDMGTSCLKLSAMAIPFLIKDDFVKKWMLPNVQATITLAAAISMIMYGAQFVQYKELANIRLQSVIGYPNTACILFFTGGYLSIFMAKGKYRKYYFVMAAVNCIAAILTFSRLGLSCFILSLSIYSLTKYPRSRQYILVCYAIAAAAGVVFVAGGYYRLYLGPTMVNRIECWIDALKVIIKMPFGIGVGTWKELQYSVQSADYSVRAIHNSFLQIMLDGGVAAFAAIVFFILDTVKHVVKNNLLLTVAFCTIFAHAFVDMDFYFICITFTLGIILRIEYKGQASKLKLYPVYTVTAFSACFISMLPVPNDNGVMQRITDEYYNAYMDNDIALMCKYSSEWIDCAPKQSSAYQAYRTSVEKVYHNENEELKSSILKLYINGEDCTVKATPVCINSEILMVPIRYVSEELGYSAEWNNISQEMEIYKDGKIVSSAHITNKIGFDDHGELRHEIYDIFMVGNRLMVRVTGIDKFLPVNIDVDINNNIIYINT